jgi:hypothetical protein
MTCQVLPPAGPFLGDVEGGLLERGTRLSKAAFVFADEREQANLHTAIAEIRSLDPNIGILDRDGLPLLSAKAAREFLDHYEDMRFCQAVRRYAGALDECQIGLTTKLMNGSVVACYERVLGEVWTWIPVRGWISITRDRDDSDALLRAGERLTCVTLFDYNATLSWLNKSRRTGVTQPYNSTKRNSAPKQASKRDFDKWIETSPKLPSKDDCDVWAKQNNFSTTSVRELHQTLGKRVGRPAKINRQE